MDVPEVGDLRKCPQFGREIVKTLETSDFFDATAYGVVPQRPP